MSRPPRKRGRRQTRPAAPAAVRSAEAAGPASASVRLSIAPEMTRTVLAIAGLDPSGGAGVAADLLTIAAFRHHGAAVVTSLTAQNTVGIQAIYDVPMEFIAQQIESVVSDIEVHAVKVGMLGTARTARLVASLIDSLRLPNVVLDPVLHASTGTALLEPKAVAVLRDQLLPRAEVVTPNMEEASVLAGIKVSDLPSMKDAARILHGLGARHVVVTGGHLGNRAVDVLFDGRTIAIFDSTKVATNNTHGIGCTFSAAVACQLARGAAVAEAVDGAKRYVARAANHSSRIGKGAGPLNHLVSPF